MRSAVALFIYNRLDTTAQVLSSIAAARPPLLLIVADGPKLGEPEDFRRCLAVRDLVSAPTWPCRVRVNYATSNLGLGRRFSSGLQWVFQQVDEAVILEDDCVPDPTFFTFCDELLARYRHDKRVMMISGDNYQFGRDRGDDSYFFSHGIGTYGWASWRRAFDLYDFNMRDWPAWRRSGFLEAIWPSTPIIEYWSHCFDETHAGRIDTWDYQWAFAMWRSRAFQIVPRSNLVSYVGCRADAVHTRDASAPYCNQPTLAMQFPLIHPSTQERHLAADLYEFYRIFTNRSHDESVRGELAPSSSRAPST
jgi:GT2 family glycosyltransferase